MYTVDAFMFSLWVKGWNKGVCDTRQSVTANWLRLQQLPCEWILMSQRYVGLNGSARTTHRHQLYLAMLPWFVPGMQQCCHGYPQTHPPSHKRGDAERFRGAGAEACPPPPSSPQTLKTPILYPLPPKLNPRPLFSPQTGSASKRLSTCQLGRKHTAAILSQCLGPPLLLTGVGCNVTGTWREQWEIDGEYVVGLYQFKSCLRKPKIDVEQGKWMWFCVCVDVCVSPQGSG